MVSSRWVRAVVGAALMTVAWASGAQAGTCNLPPWNTPAPGAPMGAAVYGHAVTSDGAFIYSASGGSFFPGGADVTLFQRYDPVANAWTTLAPVPTPVGGATLAYDAVGGRLFLFGGLDASLNVLALVQVYTIATNTWVTTGPTLPGPRFAMGSGLIGGVIYLVGGFSTYNPNLAEMQNWAFNPTTGTYTNRATLPVAKARPGSGVSGGRLYVISGQDNTGGLVNTNYEYNPAANTWAARAPTLTAVSSPGGTALSAMTDECHGDIIIVGGGTPILGGEAVPPGLSRAPESTNISQLYDVAADTWSSGPTLNTGRYALRAAQAGNTLIAFGGYDGSTTVATVDRIQGPPLPVQLQSFRVE